MMKISPNVVSERMFGVCFSETTIVNKEQVCLPQTTPNSSVLYPTRWLGLRSSGTVLYKQNSPMELNASMLWRWLSF